MRRSARGSGSKPKIVLAGIGTKGDLFPLLALGSELVGRGYACELLTNQGYADLARAHGLAFHPVTVPQTNNLVSVQENLDGHVFPSYAPTYEYFREQLARGEDLLVLNLDECSASNAMCELHGLPLCRIVLAPSKFNSVYRPAWPLNEKLSGPFAHTYQKYRLPQIYARMEQAPFVLGRINPFRARWGLRPLQRFSEINRPVLRRLGFFPDWFGLPQPDWPQNLDLLGFPLPESRARLAPELTAFIEREGKPLVFTPGTGVVDVQSFFEDARRCCERLSRPGVFLSPHYRPAQLAAESRIQHADFVDLQPLLKQSALLVHHGGIGTTARALQAAIPQIIRAEAYDQPDNGDRVAALGAGAFFAPGHYDFERLVQTVGSLLASSDVQRRLEQLSQRMARTDAIAAAADRVELTYSQGQLARGA
jgi:rhamnosyltransferase subunit B